MRALIYPQTQVAYNDDMQILISKPIADATVRALSRGSGEHAL